MSLQVVPKTTASNLKEIVEPNTATASSTSKTRPTRNIKPPIYLKDYITY